MLRYHKKIYFPHGGTLETFTDKINVLTWRYTSHTLDGMKYRFIDNKGILLFIRALKLKESDIFEYYTDDHGRIIKAGYRFTYSDGVDVIIIVSYKKELITIYTNAKDDDHITLDASLYVKN